MLAGMTRFYSRSSGLRNHIKSGTLPYCAAFKIPLPSCDDTVALAPNEISKVVYRSAPTFSLLVTQYFYKEDTTYNEIIRFR